MGQIGYTVQIELIGQPKYWCTYVYLDTPPIIGFIDLVIFYDGPKLRFPTVILDGPKLRSQTVILDKLELPSPTVILDGPK